MILMFRPSGKTAPRTICYFHTRPGPAVWSLHLTQHKPTHFWLNIEGTARENCTACDLFDLFRLGVIVFRFVKNLKQVLPEHGEEIDTI